MSEVERGEGFDDSTWHETALGMAEDTTRVDDGYPPQSQLLMVVAVASGCAAELCVPLRHRGHRLTMWGMGAYQKINDAAIRLNGREGAEARMHALAISEALAEPLGELVKNQAELVRQSQYQSQMLHALVQRLDSQG